jgi:hypothetical protein
MAGMAVRHEIDAVLIDVLVVQDNAEKRFVDLKSAVEVN